MGQEPFFITFNRLDRRVETGGKEVFRYMGNSDVKENHLKKIRIELGLTITALSRLANVSTKVISQTERMLTDPTQVTKSKIVKGLNEALSINDRKIDYAAVFPNDDY